MIHAAVIGRGRVGSALIRAWETSDIRLAEADEADIVVICVPDDAIVEVSARFAGRPMAHVSGAHPASILRGDGPKIAFHPLQTVTMDEPADVFLGVRFSVEGEEALHDTARRLVRAAGGVPVDVTPEQKRALHVAAVILSNFTVGLHAAADDILSETGLHATSDTLLRPLLDRTLDNIRKKGALASLTGPAARGDQATIDAHTAAIDDERVRDLYVAMSAYLKARSS
jgi:predicted short-subunit dehydrogenase-like oxidoreductase (DUF2520 family)